MRTTPGTIPAAAALWLCQVLGGNPGAEGGRACGLDAVIVNPGDVLGAGDRNRRVSSIIMLVSAAQGSFSVEGGLN